MTQTTPIRFAVIGAGHIGKRHAEMIQRNPDAELVALCDALPRERLGIESYNVPFFQDIQELMHSGIDFDVLSIATPNGYHAEHALIGLEHKKHIVVEKPMALSKADCEKIIFKSLTVSRQVFCIMQNRYSPPSVWIKKIIDEGVLGDIFMVQINCYWNRDDRYYKAGGWKGKLFPDGGTLFTQFSHFIDIMYWLFGDIGDIHARFRDFTHKDTTEFEDSGIIHFDFLNGGIGCLNYSTAVWDTNLESSMTIVAKNGSVKIGGQYMNEVEYCHIKDYTMPDLPPSNPANDYGPYKGSASNHNFVFDNVIDTLRHRNTITTNALEGLKVVEIIERIYSLNPHIKSSENK